MRRGEEGREREKDEETKGVERTGKEGRIRDKARRRKRARGREDKPE